MRSTHKRAVEETGDIAQFLRLVNASHSTADLIHAATDFFQEKTRKEWEQTFDSVPDLICILGTDQRIRRVNRAMAERLGAAPDTCIGKPCHDCIHPSEQPQTCPFLLTLADGRIHDMEIHDEKWHADFLVSTSPVFDTNGELTSIVHVARDITARKRAEALEREAESLACASQTAIDILESMHEGVMLLNMDGRIMSVNPALETMTGIPAGESVGRFVQELIPEMCTPQDQQLVMDVLPIAFSGRIPDMPALTLFSRTGKQMHVILSVSFVRDLNKQPREIVVTMRDISDLEGARQALEASDQKYRELVQNANSIIMRITPEHNITFFNEYAQSFFGYTEAEVLGRNAVGTIIPPVDVEGRDLRTMVQEITAQPEQYASNENENICKDGRRVWVHWANKAIHDPDGNVKEILCVGTDITERRQLQNQTMQDQHRLRELTKRLAAAEEQDRWRISRYIHDTIVQNLSLSHIRLGSLLQPLENAALTTEVQKLATIRNLLDEAINECRMVMSDLTPALLYELGLVAALQELAQQLAEKYGAEVIIENDGQELLLAQEERGFLFEAVRELIMNAIKHAGPCQIRVVTCARDGRLHIRVSDNGKGFDPLAATSTNDNHGGFGTFNIRQRLEGLGGELQIASQPAQGTTATIRLPIDT